MKIQNIDAPKHLVDKLNDVNFKSFIRKAFRGIEKDYDDIPFMEQCMPPLNPNISLPLAPNWQFPYRGHFEEIANLLHTVPVYLRDEKPNKNDDDKNSIIELLGAYYSSYNGNSPYIELYLSPIAKASKNDEEYKWLFTKVLIHELGHATLDIFNYESVRKLTQKVSYNTPFGKWREESMANALALHVIKRSGMKDFYEYAKAFVLSQPAEYALGAVYDELDYWDYRYFMDSKKDGVDADLQQLWLDYVMGTPTSDGLKRWNELCAAQYVYDYKGVYYKDACDLVPEIVSSVLQDFEEQHGKKMSYAEFCKMFPLFRTGAEDGYTEAKEVKGDSRYEKNFTLADTTVALYYFWDNETLTRFVVNTGEQYKTYQNY